MAGTAQASIGKHRAQIDLPAAIERAFASRSAQLALFVLASLVTRVAMFGDPAYHSDELLYFTIGQRMQDGFLPYVDVWDRKGPGLFLVYAAIAGLSRSVVAYQMSAALFAAATAYAICRMAVPFAGRLGALLAGLLYLVMLPLFGGGGGQAPVFYNLFMALGVWGVLATRPALAQGRVPRRLYAAMASAGFALTFKQTALFESVFLGLIVLWTFRNTLEPARLIRTAFLLALAGAAPMLLFTALFAAIGHFSEFWHAMVTSNVRKDYNAEENALVRLRALAIVAIPVLLPAIATLSVPDRRAVPRAFLGGWIAAGVVALLVVPHYIDHYMLPLVLTLSVAAAPALGRGRIGPIYAAFAIVFAFLVGPAHDFAKHRESRRAMVRIVADIEARDPHPRLLIYQGPTYLNTMTGSFPPSPLLFPTHLSHRPENDVSHLDTGSEMARDLRWQPTTVILRADFPSGALNPETAAMVARYVKRCPVSFLRPVVDYYGIYDVRIFTHCARRLRSETR